jgi:hypothetical protein
MRNGGLSIDIEMFKAFHSNYVSIIYKVTEETVKEAFRPSRIYAGFFPGYSGGNL